MNAMRLKWLCGIAMVMAAALAFAAEKGNPPGAAKASGIKATFAGGCFWCMEEAYDKVPGVISTTSGYMGGHVKNPTYQQVSGSQTGHAEVVQVVYDPGKVSYEKLVEVFWRNIDPTQKNAQFCDYGSQYRSAIFYDGDEQKRIAEASLAALKKNKPFKDEIVTEITRATEFWPAESYHQNYHDTNPVRYKWYKSGCGREARLREIWGKAGS